MRRNVRSSEAPDSDPGVNVNVVVRCRPPNRAEKNHPTCINVIESRHEIHVTQKLVHGKEISKSFTFDNVYGPTSTQQELYEKSVRSLVEEVLQGYNCTIFAYGQTSTGKTYTMEGEGFNATNPRRGVIARSVEQIFQTLERSHAEYTVKISCLELYNEELQDLLAIEPDKKLRIFEDVNGRNGVIISGLEELVVKNTEEVMKILSDASHRRQTAYTNMNNKSSRSHVITSITIHMKESTTDAEDLIKTGKLYLVDLAGSENIGRSGALKKRAQEAGMINQSLLTLGRVITALTEHCPHVPYRESKLTRLLQDSLGGKTKTLIIATISPSVLNLEESLSTLEYARRAKNIKNQPEQNMKMTKKHLIKEMTADIERLKYELMAARQKNGVYLPTDIYNEKMALIDEQAMKIKELEEQLALLTKEMEEINALFANKTKELQEERETHSNTRKTLEETQITLMTTENLLKETTNELNENKYLLKEHQNTEEKLYDQAELLLKSMRESIHDIDGFKAKIERKALVENHNQQTTSAFQQNMMKHAHALENKLQSLADYQKNMHEMMMTSISQYLDKKGKQVEDVQSELNNILSMIGKSSEEILAMVTSRFNEANLNTTNLINNQNEFEKKMIESFNAVTSNVSNIVKKTNNKLNMHQKEISELVKLIDNAFKKNCELVSEFSALHKEALDKLLASLKENFDKQIHNFNEFANQIKKTHEDQKVYNRKMKLEILKKFEEMLDANINESENTFHNFVLHVNERLQNNVKDVNEFERNANSCVNHVHDQFNHFNYLLKNSQNEIFTQVEERSKNIHQIIHESSKDAFNLDNFINNSSNDIISSLQENNKNLSKTLLEEDERMNKYLNENKEYMAKLDEEVKVGHKRTFDKIQSMSNDIDTFSNEISNINNQQIENVNKSISTKRNITNQIKNELDTYSKNLKVDVPTNTTPKKRNWNIPKQLYKTRDHSLLLQEFRSKHQVQDTTMKEQNAKEQNVVEQEPATPIKEIEPNTPIVKKEMKPKIRASTPKAQVLKIGNKKRRLASITNRRRDKENIAPF